jgi:predicted PurR-regulated permease PerM
MPTNEWESLRWPRWLPWVVGACLALVLYRLGSELFGEVVHVFRPVLVPLLISLAFAYLLEPLVTWLPARWKLGLEVAIILAIVVGGLALLGSALFIIPPVVAQVIESGQKLPDAVRSATEAVKPVLEGWHARYPTAYESAIKKLSGLTEGSFSQGGSITGFLSKGLEGLVGVTANLLNLILIPVFSFYILRDLDKARQSLERLIPPRFRTGATRMFDRLESVVSNFVRGQLTVAVVLCVLYSLGYFLVGAPLPLSLGVLAGFGYLIPYLGAFIAVMLAILLAVMAHPTWWTVISILIVYLVVHLIEGFVLTPRILGDRLQLHPLFVIIGLIIGGSLFGILGIILALPVMAIMKVILESIKEPYFQSGFYDRVSHPSDE